MITFKQKEFGFLDSLFGEKPIEMSTKDLYEAYNKPGIKIDPKVQGEIYSISKLSKASVPGDIWEYLTVLKNEFPGNSRFINPKTKEIMFGWDEIKKNLNRFVRSFRGKPILILGKNEDGDYIAYFPKAGHIWFFDIKWGGYSQGLFGIGEDCKKAINITLK